MVPFDNGYSYPSARTLIDEKVASRIRAKDASLYAFSSVAHDFASRFMGWTDLAENPPCSLIDIQSFADATIAEGIERVVVIAQGGSVQAPMTMADYHIPEGNRVMLTALDSDTPTGFREALAGADLSKTLCVMSSKSGGTIEPNVLMSAVKAVYRETMSAEEAARHFVAITDPGSDLQKMAQRENWRAIFYGEPSVGGRFSALSVFGLVPAAFIGIDLKQLMTAVAETERRCALDTLENPAIRLASFLYDNQQAGRGKFSLVTPPRAATLCLWIEQLIAESTGKEGKGELPNTESDTSLLSQDAGDRCVITYRDMQDTSSAARAFSDGLGVIAAETPRIDVSVDGTVDLVSHFVIWEYATAMLGWLMKICPFDQPDVQSTKTKVLDILAGEPVCPATVSHESFGLVELRLASLGAATDLDQALKKLLFSIDKGDYFSLNAFLPKGAGRYEELEGIRHAVAAATGVVSCLELGPRYLHSIGQLQKGGPNNGVFLILCADDDPDISVTGQKVSSLAQLAATQALGDYSILAQRARRALLIHLPSTSVEVLALLKNAVDDALAARRANR